MKATSRDELSQVQFYDPAIGYENLWTSDTRKRGFRIESIPFFIYGISLHDVVAASPDDHRRLQFSRVLKRSGNRTLRARSDEFAKNAAKRKSVIASLKGLGADVEELRSRLVAINVPPVLDLKKVTDYLTNDAKLSWEYGSPAEIHR